MIYTCFLFVRIILPSESISLRTIQVNDWNDLQINYFWTWQFRYEIERDAHETRSSNYPKKIRNHGINKYNDDEDWLRILNLGLGLTKFDENKVEIMWVNCGYMP